MSDVKEVEEVELAIEVKLPGRSLVEIPLDIGLDGVEPCGADFFEAIPPQGSRNPEVVDRS